MSDNHKRIALQKDKISAFTIVELIVVVSVIIILATIVALNYGDWQKNIVTTQIKSDLNGVASAMEDYRNFNNQFPASVPASFKPSRGTSINGGSLNSGKTYCVDATSDGQSFSISNYKIVFPGVCPVLYFEAFDKASYSGSGVSVEDISGQDDHGTLTGGVTYNSDGGGSLSFDGTDDWIDGITQPNIKTGPNEFTISGVIKPDNKSSYIITPDSNGQDQSIYFKSSSERLFINVVEAQNLNRRTRSTDYGTVPVGKWTYWAITLKDKNIKMYINGSLASEYSETINIADWSGVWRIGKRGGAYAEQYYYKGLAGLISVYGRVLTDDEINSNYEALRSRYGL